MYYEEQIDGMWQRLTLDGEMLMGRAHHVIYFDSPAQWQSYPSWARDRRTEILARVKSELREPDYEYAELTPPNPPTRTGGDAPPVDHNDAHTHASGDIATPEQRRALLLAIVLVFAIASVAGWAGISGLSSGATRWPTARPSQRRVIQQASEPVMFYTAIGVYAILGVATLALGVWGSGQLVSLRVRQPATGS